MNREISNETKNFLKRISASEGSENLAQLIEAIRWSDLYVLTTPHVNAACSETDAKYTTAEVFGIIKPEKYKKEIKAALKVALIKSKPEIEKFIDGNEVVSLTYTPYSGLSGKIKLATPVKADGKEFLFITFRQNSDRYSYSITTR